MKEVAIAVEFERTGEGQRCVTSSLAGRGKQALAASVAPELVRGGAA